MSYTIDRNATPQVNANFCRLMYFLAGSVISAIFKLVLFEKYLFDFFYLIQEVAEDLYGTWMEILYMCLISFGIYLLQK